MRRLEFDDLTLDPHDHDVVLRAIERVITRGQFILGPEVAAFESELAATTGVTHAVGVGSGTDALILGLRCLGIGPGDEVIIPAFTAFPTAAAVLDVGATPVITDVESRRPHLDLDLTLSAITSRTRAVILVHLYGVPADTRPFIEAITPLGISLIEDCAQAQGATLPSGEPVGSAGAFGALSFYPTKNLGGIGDGGAIVTNDAALASEARSRRAHGERGRRGIHELSARNSRLDEVQAAVLRIRLGSLRDRVDHARRLSERYRVSLPDSLEYVDHGQTGAPHLAVIRTVKPTPVELAAHLDCDGIASRRHYERSLRDQPALASHRGSPTPNALQWSSSCLSLPLHRWMRPTDVDRVVEAVTRHILI